MRGINFYTYCTLGKNARVPRTLSMVSVRAASLETRFSKWTTQLDQAKCVRMDALALYSGGHWSVVRGIQRNRAENGLPLHCRVISAGYGLLSVSDKICPYAATFSPGHPDSVSPVAGTVGPTRCRQWWKMLTEWKPVNVAGPRSFREVFKQEAGFVHLFALSPSYLDAISDDLLEALAVLPNKDDLIIFSSGKRRQGRLNDNIIPTEARLQTRLGGAMASLNVRTAAEVINRLLSGATEPNGVRRLVSKLSSESRSRPTFNRQRVKDFDVSRFITQELRKQPEATYTPLLHAFRKSGNACEMKRFRSIHEKTRSKLYENHESRR